MPDPSNSPADPRAGPPELNPFAAPASTSAPLELADPNDVAPLGYGGFWRRVGAKVLDNLMLTGIAKMVSLFMHASPEQMDTGAILNLGIVLGYTIAMVGKYGSTYGKMFLHLQIVRSDGTVAGYREAALREVPLILYSIALIMVMGMQGTPQAVLVVVAIYGLVVIADVAWMATNVERRTLHDLIAGTMVVRVEKMPVGEAMKVGKERFANLRKAVAKSIP